VLHFTIGTGGTLFFTIYIVTGTAKINICSVLINFVEGCAFLSSAAELIGTYSIEIEFAYCIMVCAKH